MLAQLKRFVDRLRGGTSERSSGHQPIAAQFDDPAEQLDHARSLVEQQQHTRAAHHFKQVLEARPTDATAHREFADLLAETGYHESASRHYERALEFEPDADVHETLATLLAEKGETRKAARHHERARSQRAS